MKKQEKIQAFLFIVGVFLILITYFYYPYKNKSLVEKNIQEDMPSVSDNLTDKSTSFDGIDGRFSFKENIISRELNVLKISNGKADLIR